MQFTFEAVADLIEQVLSRGYSMLRLDQDPDDAPGKAFYLRHDVDISIIAAARLGEIEHSIGVKSSFFFLLGGDTYNLLSTASLDTLETLRSQGHCVGLHIDERVVRGDPVNIARTVEWFKDCVTLIDSSVSFHRPTERVMRRDYGSIASAYRNAVFSEESYLSDSRRSLAFYDTLQLWMQESRTPIQLLLHPGWWYPEPDAHEFKRILMRRRVAEVEQYLSKNYNKVFGALKKNEDGTPGL